MYIYNKKKQLICTFLIVTILVLTTGCNQDYTKGTPFDKSEGNNGATTESPDKVSSPETVTEENTSEPSDASSVSDDKAPELSPTANNQEISNNENDSAQESPTESVAPQETTSTATPEIQPETTAPIPTQAWQSLAPFL